MKISSYITTSVLVIAVSFIILPSAKSQMSIAVGSSYFLGFSRSSEIKYDDNFDFLTYRVKFIEEDVSPVFGGYFALSNEKLQLRLGFHHRQIKSRFSIINYLEFPNLQSQQIIKKTNSILIPVDAGFRIENIVLGAGPSVAIHYQTESPFNILPDFEEKDRLISGGFHLFLNYEFNKLQLEIQYEQRFHGVAEQIKYRGDEKSFKQSSQYLGLFLYYRFAIN